MDRSHWFPPGLINSYHALAILAGVAFLVALLSPGTVGGLGRYAGFFGPPLFLATLALVAGFLGVHVGEAEAAWWAERPLPPGRTLARLAALVGLGIWLILPFLISFRALTGESWGGMAGALGAIIVVGLAWAGAGFLAGSVIESGGIRFVGLYGVMLLVYLVPLVAAFPVSPISTVTALWKGDLEQGLVGLGCWGGLAALSLGGTWAWKRTRS
ncbi:hypothetical protein H5T52_08110 [Candidatus Bipolaricaulota bacterium]|nr:hypothetical protein [Candidatus Bipolaricaulota bacterium]